MSLLPLFQDQVDAHPDAVAVIHENSHITYRQLGEDAARIAAILRQKGAQPGSLVAVYLSRSPRLIACLLGIWQAGAAYVPLDPTHPSERTAFMAEDSSASFLVTETNLLSLAPRTQAKVLDLTVLLTQPGEPAVGAPHTPADHDLAYVIYTSGSTGRPKGAMISHGSLTNTILGVQHDMQLQPDDVVLASNSVAFDISGQEFYLPLIAGARIHLVDRELTADGPRLMQELRDAGITVMMGLTSSFRLLLAAGWRGDANLQLTIGGEALSLELANQLAERSRALWNQYGPTETSITATTERVFPGSQKITLGRPLNNVRVYVLNEQQERLSAGEVGEIYIGGAGVGLGYLNRPELTARCFIADPFYDRPGATMYKTGDYGTMLVDGRIDFLGRVDEQVKIRGFRIEMGEVEAALDACPGVKGAVARAIDFAPDDKRLIAFLLSDRQLDRDELRAAMRGRLPDYMVPAEYIVLPAFPLLPTGKIDRRALDTLRLEYAPAVATDEDAGDIEAKLQRIWQGLLRTRDVKREDNFFDLGGHSLLAARMIAQIEKKLGVKVPVSILAEHPTLAELANYLRRRSVQTPLVLKLADIQSGVPLFLAHGIGGSLLTFRELAPLLGVPVYGVRMPESLDEIAKWENGLELGPSLIQKLAARYVEDIRAIVPNGPYQLAGHSSAGLVVVEMANQLRQLGAKVHLLALLDPDIRPGKSREKAWKSWEAAKAFFVRNFVELKLAPKYGIRELVERRLHYQKLKLQFWFVQRLRRYPRLYRNAFATEGCLAVALNTFRPDRYAGDALLFVGQDEPRAHDDPALGWTPYITGNLEIFNLPGGHHSIFTGPYVNKLAEHLKARLHLPAIETEVKLPTTPLVPAEETMTESHELIGVKLG